MAEYIQVDKAFIEAELPTAPPLYVSVYLMTLAIGRDAARVAEKLNATQSDVLRAWAYWMDRGAMQRAEQKKPPEKPLHIPSERPDYAPAELAVYLKNESVRHLFDYAQKKLGKLLSHNDMSTIFSFHDWLGLPMDVIELLLSYCAAEGHKGMRYIEKVAIGWAEEGIDTEEKAIAYIELRKHGFRTILKAFGQGNRMPVATEEKYMRTWMQEYRLPLEIIRIACERTVMQTGKASFPYADKILRDWSAAKVKTPADIEALDQAFAAKKNQGEGQKPARREAPKQNRFINYTQSDWDFAELERLEREQRDKW